MRNSFSNELESKRNVETECLACLVSIRRQLQNQGSAGPMFEKPAIKWLPPSGSF